MPAAIPLIVGIGAQALGASALVAGAAAVAASLIVGSYQQRKAQRQARDQYNAAQVDRMANVVTSVMPRELVLGRARKGGAVPFRGSAGTFKSRFIVHLALAGHEIDGVEQVYFNDVPVTLDASGRVLTAPYFRTRRASATATIPPGRTLVDLPFTPVAGSVFGHLETGDTGIDAPPNIVEVVMVGPTAVISTTFGFPVTVTYQYDEVLSYARVWWDLGAPGSVADGTTKAAFPDLWTNAHRGEGVAKLFVEFDYDETAFPSGVPTVTALVRGAKVYDPRTGLTNWSDNPALLARHVYQHPSFGKASVSSAEDARISAAANACDASQNWVVGGVTDTQKLYRAGLVVPFGTPAESALNDLVQAMGGAWMFAAGELYIRAGVFTAAVMSFTEADLAVVQRDGDKESLEGLNVSVHRERADKFNVVNVRIWDAAQGYKLSALTPLKGASLITRDGKELSQEVQMAAVYYAPQALHVAGIGMRDARDALTVQVAFKLRAYPLEIFDVVQLTLARYGWTSKTFMVLWRQWDHVRGVMRLTLKETAAAIYTPDAAFLAQGYAANTALPDPWNISPPGTLSISSGTSELQIASDGTIITRVRVSWPAIADPRVTNDGSIEVQWSQAGTLLWHSQAVAGSLLETFLSGPTERMLIVVRARVRTSLAFSDWGVQQLHQVVGKTEPPQAPTGVSLTQELVFFRPPPDLDLAGVRIRSLPGLVTSPVFSRGTDVIDGLVKTSPARIERKLYGVQTIVVVAEDTSGNQSDPAFATLDFGQPDLGSAIWARDLADEGFLRGSAVLVASSVVSGEVVADVDSGSSVYALDNLYGEPDVYATLYQAMSWQSDMVIAPYAGALTLESTIEGNSALVEYRVNADTLRDLYAMADLYAASDVYGAASDWALWPGTMDVRRMVPMDFRVSIGAGSERGTISEFTLSLVLEEVSQTFAGITVDAAGSRLVPTEGSPPRQWIGELRAVYGWPAVDGSGAIAGRALDFSPRLGPLVQFVNAAGDPVTALGTVKVEGFSDESIIGLDVTPPVVAPGQSFSYSEIQSPGYVIGAVAATDNVAVAGYRFGDTGTSISSDGWFSIDNDGVVTLTTSGAFSAANDFEVGPNSFTHPVQAQDAQSNWSDSQNVTFNVLNSVADDAVMSLFMNLGAPTYYTGALPFANLMMHADPWTQFAGSTGWTLGQGTISGAAGTDEFRTPICDGKFLTAGVEYTVLNPQGASVGYSEVFGSAPTLGTSGGAYKTNTSYTFTWPGGTGILTAFVKGNLADSLGPLVCIRTSDLTNYLAGNIWHPDFLAFYSTVVTKGFRTMDWTGGSKTAEVDWSDRTLPNKPTLVNKAAIFTGASVPYEYIIDLANRTGRDVWVSIPPRASDAYITSLANLFKDGTGAVGSIGNAGLSVGRNVWFELGNEQWNFAADYYANTRWTESNRHTRNVATISGSTFTFNAHGMASSDPVRGWNTAANRRAGVDDFSGGTNWFNAGIGVPGNSTPTNGLYAKSLTVNTFELYLDSALTNKVIPPAGATTWIFSKELQFTPNIDTNYGLRSKEAWDIITPILTTSRYKRLISGQAGAESRVVPRLAGSVGPAADYYTIAPYFNGEPIMVAVDHVSGTQVSVKFHAQRNGTYKTNIFSSGTAQPLETVLENHTGAISGHDHTYTKKWQDVSPPTGGNETGLTNATSYTGYASYRNTESADGREVFLHTVRFDFTTDANKSGTSTTSFQIVDPALGSTSTTPTFTTQTGKSFAAGQSVHVFRTSDPTAYVSGKVTSYNSGTGALVLDLVPASVTGIPFPVQQGLTYGTFANWTICTREFYFDALANMELRNKLDTDYLGSKYIDNHFAQIALSTNTSLPLACYEGGDHMSGDGEPSELASWIFNTYLPTSNYGNAMKYNLHTIADKNVKVHCWFGDNNGNVWSITDRYTNTTDPRVVAYASFGGSVPKQTAVNIPDFNAPDITSAPGALPYTVYTFPDATLTYTIMAGDPTGLFAMSGNVLQMVSTTGVNFAAPSLRNLYIRATDGNTSDTPKVSFFTGSGWYAGDASFALKMSAQTTASMVPDVGGTLTLTGSGASIASNLLVCGASASYANSSGMSAAQDFTKPCVIALLGNSNGATYTGQWLLWIGSGGRWVRASPDTGALLWEIFDGTTTTQISCAWDATNKSNWLYHDGAGNYTVGRDATTVNTGTQTPPSGPNATISQSVSIGSTTAKLGTIETVWRTGLTLAQAKTLAQGLPA
jgi:hypothetical protein